jgi:hypothetical protein
LFTSFIYFELNSTDIDILSSLFSLSTHLNFQFNLMPVLLMRKDISQIYTVVDAITTVKTLGLTLRSPI